MRKTIGLVLAASLIVPVTARAEGKRTIMLFAGAETAWGVVFFGGLDNHHVPAELWFLIQNKPSVNSLLGKTAWVQAVSVIEGASPWWQAETVALPDNGVTISADGKTLDLHFQTTRLGEVDIHATTVHQPVMGPSFQTGVPATGGYYWTDPSTHTRHWWSVYLDVIGGTTYADEFEGDVTGTVGANQVWDRTCISGPNWEACRTFFINWTQNATGHTITELCLCDPDTLTTATGARLARLGELSTRTGD